MGILKDDNDKLDKETNNKENKRGKKIYKNNGKKKAKQAYSVYLDEQSIKG